MAHAAAQFGNLFLRNTSKALTIVWIELRKLRRDPSELISRAVQPILWLAVFGQVMTRTRALSTGNMRYIDFLAPGILAQSALFTAIFFGLSAIWERDLGILHKQLASPAPRAALVTGKALSAALRGLVQAVIVYALAALLGVHINWNPLALLGSAGAVALGSAVFATFSLIIACAVRSRERFMGVGQVMTMPLFFASNAIYPISLMPPWLQVVSRGNPLTYQVDLLRAFMIAGANRADHPLLDVVVLLGTAVVLILIAAKMYPALAR
jgi:ABC-2 type transport system permease protein